MKVQMADQQSETVSFAASLARGRSNPDETLVVFAGEAEEAQGYMVV
jgi:hypothetical protein